MRSGVVEHDGAHLVGKERSDFVIIFSRCGPLAVAVFGRGSVAKQQKGSGYDASDSDRQESKTGQREPGLVFENARGSSSRGAALAGTQRTFPKTDLSHDSLRQLMPVIIARLRRARGF